MKCGQTAVIGSMTQKAVMTMRRTDSSSDIKKSPHVGGADGIQVGSADGNALGAQLGLKVADGDTDGLALGSTDRRPSRIS